MTFEFYLGTLSQFDRNENVSSKSKCMPKQIRSDIFCIDAGDVRKRDDSVPIDETLEVDDHLQAQSIPGIDLPGLPAFVVAEGSGLELIE